MKRIDYDCAFDMADALLPLLETIDDTYPVISVYGKYDVIKTLLEDLIMSGVEIAKSIELESYEIDYYDKEFVLYLTQDGVATCKIWKHDSYLRASGNISFVHEDCSSKILKYIDSDIVYEFGIDGSNDEHDDYCEEKCDCDACCECCACGNELSTSKETYTINGKPVNKEEFLKVEKDFAKEFKDSLLSWCEAMDEMNEWRKFFINEF